jgi:predicted metal-dependent hydrolase
LRTILGLRREPARPSRAERSITIEGASIPVRIIENRRAKRLTLRIVPGARALRLTTPPHVSDADLSAFLERNRAWAATRLARLPDPVSIANGAMIPYLGLDHRIEHVGGLRGLVEPGTRNGTAVLLVPGEAGAIERRLRQFFVREARIRLTEAAMTHARALGVRPSSIRIGDASSRWGSCSTSRTLSFSWRIIMAPPEILDYLAAHEVAHLVEMNHSPAFWHLVRRLCPQMERKKAWLSKNGAMLHTIRLD